MQLLRRWIPLLVVAIGISAAAIAAAAPYDAPTIQSIRASQASITLRVTAAPSGAPGGFTIQYMTGADYDYYGWDQSYAYTCSCWGTPAWNFDSSGQATYLLAPQLIGRKPTIAQGANPPPVAATLAAADAMIGGLIVPPLAGSGFLSPATTSGLATILDNYNNGFTSVPHCGDTPTRSSSWGRVKTLYR